MSSVVHDRRDDVIKPESDRFVHSFRRTLAVNLLTPASSSNTPRSHSADQSGTASPVSSSSALPLTADKSHHAHLHAEEAEPRSRKRSTLKIPAFLRRKSAAEHAQKHDEPHPVAAVPAVDGLPASHPVDAPSVKTTEPADAPKAVEGAPVLPLGKEIV